MANPIIEIKGEELEQLLLQWIKDREQDDLDPHMVSFRFDTDDKLVATVRCKPIEL